MSIYKASIQDVVTSVRHSDTCIKLPDTEVKKVVDTTLCTVIGINCLGRGPLHIELDNGYTLVCQVKKSVGPTDV